MDFVIGHTKTKWQQERKEISIVALCLHTDHSEYSRCVDGKENEECWGFYAGKAQTWSVIFASNLACDGCLFENDTREQYNTILCDRCLEENMAALRSTVNFWTTIRHGPESWNFTYMNLPVHRIRSSSSSPRL